MCSGNGWVRSAAQVSVSSNIQTLSIVVGSAAAVCPRQCRVVSRWSLKTIAYLTLDGYTWPGRRFNSSGMLY